MATFDDNYKRDSFDDRVCDDLSEVILEFLPLEDKLRFQCVSKQFQRTVFQKHNNLVINSKLEKAIINKKVDLKTFLQKLPNIKSFTSNSLKPKTSLLEDPDIDQLIQSFDNLDEIHCNFYKISEQMRDKFSKRLGSKVTKMSAKPHDIPMISQHFPNIETLITSHFYRSALTSDQMSGLVLNKLRRVCIRFNEPEIGDQLDQQLNSFKQFLENHKSLTHLTIELFITNIKTFEVVFNQISDLNELIELNIQFSNGIPDKVLANGLRQLSLSCSNLKSLYLKYVEIKETAKDILFAKVLQKYKQLKRLEIHFHAFPKKTKTFGGVEALIESFNGLDLTHLKLYFSTDLKTNDSIITNIVHNFPKLQELELNFTMNATEGTVYSLSGLSNLRKLKLELSDQVDMSIVDFIHLGIIKNCKKVTSILL